MGLAALAMLGIGLTTAFAGKDTAPSANAKPRTASGGDSGGRQGDARECDKRLIKAMDATGLKYRVDNDNDVNVVMDTTGGRTQLVIVNSATEKYAGIEVREVWSIVGDLPKSKVTRDVLFDLMYASAKMKMGAYVLYPSKNNEGGARFHFVVQVDSESDGDTLKAIVELVAKAADEQEKNLESGDETDKY